MCYKNKEARIHQVKALFLLQIVIAVLLLLSFPAFGNQTEAMHRQDTSTTHSKEIKGTSMDHSRENPEETGESVHLYRSSNIPAEFHEFPNLHPLVVHFPIVLLLLAFFSQLFSFFTLRKALSFVTIALLAGGFVGAILAARIYHPHITEGLPDRMVQLFETHMKYANITLWLAGISLAIKLISHFLFRLHIVTEILVFLSLAASATMVCLTGHLGSQMVYIEGIGPQGNSVEMHEHEGQEHTE
jgi:uncharacterized membrane protein